MNIEHLPSRLHIKFSSRVDIEALLPIAESVFPDAEKTEIKNDTLYIYEANDFIEFIHISQQKIGVIFAPEVVTSGDTDQAWGFIDPLMSKLKVSKLSKLDWEIKLVQPFKSKKERDVASFMLSPIDGYGVGSLTLYPKENSNYSISLEMVNKDKKEYGIMLNVEYKVKSISRKDVSSKLAHLRNEFTGSEYVHSITKRITSE